MDTALINRQAPTEENVIIYRGRYRDGTMSLGSVLSNHMNESCINYIGCKTGYAFLKETA